MGNRYIITGAELGLLISIPKQEDRSKLVDKIIIENYIGDKDSPEFTEMKMILKRLRRRIC